MNDVVVGDEKFVPTARASELSGYSKDYIGQLCRSEKLICRRISGHWYIKEESITAYQKGDSHSVVSIDATNKEDAVVHKKPKEKPVYGIKAGNIRDDTFSYDGVEYIATSRAAELTGYAQDYIGQLARNDEVEARKVGRRWFVGKDTLIAHKKHNDGLLAAVQAEASGLGTPVRPAKATSVYQKGEKHVDVEALGTPVEIQIHSDVTPGDINFNVRYIAEHDEPLLPKVPYQGGTSKSYASGDISTTIDEHAQKTSEENNLEAIKGVESRFSTLEPLNTTSREGDDSIFSPKTHVQNPVVLQSVEKKSSHTLGVFGILLLVVLILGALGGYYFFDPTVLELFAKNTFLQELNDTYGHIFPGNNFEYSTE